MGLETDDVTEKIGDVQGQIRLIDQLHLLQLFVGRYDEVLATAKRGEAVALTSNDPIAVARMRVLLSISYQYLGRFVESRSYIEAALRHPGMDGDILSGLTLEYPKRAQITLARVLWLQGYPDQAAQMVRRAISVIKKRTSAHEDTIREFRIDKRGITLREPLIDFQGVLRGVPSFVGRGAPLLDTESDVM